MMLELDRWARHYDVEMKMNPHFPFNTIRLMRGAVAALRQERFAEYHPRMFRAVWSEGRNVGKEETLREMLESSGIDPASIDGDEIKKRVARQYRPGGRPRCVRSADFLCDTARYSGATIDSISFEDALKRAA